MRVVLYARHSSDQQRTASIADQLRVCRGYVERQGYRAKVARLCEGLEQQDGREAVIEAIRGLIDRITIEPQESGVWLWLHSNLAALLEFASENKNGRQEGGRVSAMLVAGAGFEPATFGL